ncbi:SEC-C metal-binding domain-containing protein [Kribbella sp. NPDC004536]|uniref:SEC-C metal-binding domain-containing protein n=1 Tax=Kribbella sp. NPDC004536 TaxID=3364106 RepID=UPI0036CE7AF1
MNDPLADEVRDPRTKTNTMLRLADERAEPRSRPRAVAPWERSFNETGSDEDLARVGVAGCLFAEGRDDEARAELAAVMANKYFYSPAWARAAELLEAIGEEEEALDWYEVATDRATAEEVSRSRMLQRMVTGRRRVKWALQVPLDGIDLLGVQGDKEAREREADLRELLREPMVVGGQIQVWDRGEFDAGVPWRNQFVGDDPDAYCRKVERTLRLEDRRVTIATWTYGGFLDCLEDARLQQQDVPDGRRIVWPPARNEACWCGSGVKYKRCCGGPLPAVEPVSAPGDSTG